MTGKDQGFPLGLSHFFSFVTVYGLGGGPFHALDEAGEHMGPSLSVPTLPGSFSQGHCQGPPWVPAHEHQLAPVKVVPIFPGSRPDSSLLCCVSTSGGNDMYVTPRKVLS